MAGSTLITGYKETAPNGQESRVQPHQGTLRYLSSYGDQADWFDRPAQHTELLHIAVKEELDSTGD